MIAPDLPLDEATRLDALHALNVLDTPAEERFDRITRLARRLFGVPIALISLVDTNRQWFKSRQGLEASQTGRDVSFCGHAILRDDILLVEDATKDPRFHDNPLVVGEPHIRFYAGCPLVIAGNSKIGTLCLIDRQPRKLDREDLDLLRDLARMAVQELAAVRLATTDELTTLSNRRGFATLAQHALAMCVRLKRPATLFLFDLDGFKAINDSRGHAEGDRALAAFAGLLGGAFRDSDVIGRLGGDEFVALMTDCSEAHGQGVLTRLQAAVAAHNRSAGLGYDIRFSVGAASFDPVCPLSVSDLIQQADARMYEHKRSRASN
jgi:diguanylate cyclase (GGDEF)-like protein